MRMPGWTAAASLYQTRAGYSRAASWGEGAGGRGVIPQQDLVPPLPAPSLFPWRCSPCTWSGWQVCCPPPGFGVRCVVRRCLRPLS